jgi:uncharacterized delta-60 repeat protein
MKLSILFVIINLFVSSLFAQFGTLDTSFGKAGKVITENSNGKLSAAAILPDGRIVTVGSIVDSLAIICYLANGNIDSSFGENGFLKLSYETSGYWGEAKALIIQPDGKILFGGYWGTVAATNLILVRLNSNGTLDNSFGSSGIVKANYNNAAITSIALQNDKKIVVGATMGLYMYVLRFLPDGIIDASFGNSGITPSFFAGNAEGLYVTVQTDGKIIGTHTNYGDIGLVRYKTEGTFDSTFGVNGRSIVDMSGVDDRAYSILLQPDQKIIVAGGFNYDFYNTNFGVARFKTDGTLDSSFGSSGITSVDFSGSVDVAFAAALQPGGKIIAGGFINDHFGLARYKNNGTPDSSFGINGHLITDFGSVSEAVYSVFLQQDGKTVAAGSDGYLTHYLLARYNNDVITNIKSGLWSDPAIWSNNIVPDETTKIELGFDVIIDINAKCKSLKTNNHIVTVNQNVNLFVYGESK